MAVYSPPQYVYFKGIRLEDWVFDAEGGYGTLQGLIRHVATGRGKALCRCAFLADFGHISSFFAIGGEQEDTVLKQMFNLLCTLPDEGQALFFSFCCERGKAMYLPEAVVKAYPSALDTNAFGNFSGETLYVVESVMTLSEYRTQQQRQQLRKGLNNTLDRLSRCYEKYERLRQNGTSEAVARQKCRLEDDTLFLLAAQKHALAENLLSGKRRLF